MIIIGDKYIPSPIINKISKIEDIKSTQPNSIVLFEFDKDIMSYCYKNNIEYGVIIKNITDSLYANNLNAKYILPPKDLLKEIQNIAENYLFDSKILATIENINSIEDIALKGIDGVIFNRVLL